MASYLLSKTKQTNHYSRLAQTVKLIVRYALKAIMLTVNEVKVQNVVKVPTDIIITNNNINKSYTNNFIKAILEPQSAPNVSFAD